MAVTRSPSPREKVSGQEAAESPEEWSSQLAELRAGLAELRADHDALLACLERQGLPGFAQVQRERAARAEARLATRFDNMLGNRGLAERILAGAGQLAWASSRRVSRATQRAADAVREEKIFAVGGITETFGRGGNNGRELTAIEQYNFGINHQLRNTQMLDLDSGRWQPGVRLPFGAHRHASAVLGGFLYIFGGVPPISRNVLRFNPVSLKWTQLPRMSCARVGGHAVALQKRIYVLGGVTFEPVEAVISAMECYDPGSYREDRGTWTQLPNMPTPRRDFGAAAFRGKVVLCGGCDRLVGEEASLNRTLARSVDAFCPTSHAWEPLPLLMEERAEPAACNWKSTLYVCGGSVPVSGRIHRSIEVYEPSSRAWSIFGSMREPRNFLGAVAVGGQLYLMGGFRYIGKGEAWASAESMDLASGESRSIAPMSVCRAAFACGTMSLGPGFARSAAQAAS